MDHRIDDPGRLRVHFPEFRCNFAFQAGESQAGSVVIKSQFNAGQDQDQNDGRGPFFQKPVRPSETRRHRFPLTEVETAPFAHRPGRQGKGLIQDRRFPGRTQGMFHLVVSGRDQVRPFHADGKYPGKSFRETRRQGAASRQDDPGDLRGNPPLVEKKALCVFQLGKKRIADGPHGRSGRFRDVAGFLQRFRGGNVHPQGLGHRLGRLFPAEMKMTDVANPAFRGKKGRRIPKADIQHQGAGV